MNLSEYSGYLNFLTKNFMFSTVIILVSFTLGWILYNHVILRKICLKDALFEKDNLAAWIEFIGAFIFPTLYLAAKALEGSASANLMIDLAICTGYVIAYIFIFTVLRMLSGTIVRYICPEDKDGKVCFNNEIYTQKNIASALFSVALSTIFVSIIRFLDIMPDYIIVSVLRMSVVTIFTLIAFIGYTVVLRRKTSLFKEIFIDNNIAAGVSFLGFMFAVQTILDNLIELQKEFNFFELIAYSSMGLVLFGILSVLFKWLFTKVIRVDVWHEVYEQDNVGAAIGQVALYIGIANVIVHFIK
ncbi:MAG: DUF350 domain-containing protein [Clostridia bacterium]|nr:DUF350 domain-containing protein [Clostridia bacterium]